jgi:uncharacterized membrane protein YebE (DUF533 family)
VSHRGPRSRRYAATLFVLLLVLAGARSPGHAGPAERADVAAILIRPGGDGVDTAWVESALRDRFELEPAAQPMFRVVYF